MENLSPSDARDLTRRLTQSIGRGLVGQANLVAGLVRAVLAGGHVLIEGVPGLAKTRSVNLLARACGGAFGRIQFTPDLLPADITGTEIYRPASGTFETKTGPLFANFVLADEINRAAPKVQSALLEAMQERQVTIGERTYPLPHPFFVFATQNPVEQEGTYPLPEAQIDRFLMKLVVPYPARDEEQAIVRMVMSETELPTLDEPITCPAVVALQAATREIFVEDRIIDYATRIVAATRDPAAAGLPFDDAVHLGASPRASIALVQVARALALTDGREEVIPEHVKGIAPDVLRHRVLLTYHAEAEGVTPAQVVDELLARVKVP